VLVKSLFKKRLEKCSTPGQKQKIDSLYKETETEDDNNIPESWRFTFLSKICESFQYGTSAKSDKEGKVVVLRMGNLQNGKIDWSELAYTSDDKEIEKYLLEKNTVLFNRTNSPELVGKTSIYNGDRKAIFAGYLIRINSYSDVLDSHYLNFALNTGYAREFCHREKTDGVSQSNINAQKLAHFELPLPPLEEQKEIVRQVDKLFALADKVEEHYKKAKAKVDNLSQSVLAKAFRGELVPQDPNDEPAEKLLERIMEEKAKMESAFKTMKKKVSQKIKENKNSISGD
jgi:type I restriction enzyme S subunit